MRFLYALALLAISAAANAQVPSYVPTTGLLGWWPFNGNANDESGNGNNGTVNGAVLTNDRNGTVNNAYNFNGIDQNIDGNIASLASLSSSTLTAWMRFTGNAGGQPYDSYFQLGVYGSHTFAYGYEYGSQNFNLYSFCTYLPTVPPGNLNNAWHFVAIVDSETETFLYVDGNLLASGSGGAGGSCFQGSAYFQMGGGSDNQWVTGDMDDIGLWNVALTQQQIQGLFQASSIPCLSPTSTTMSGLNSSYITSDPGAALVGTPPDGIFIGPGISESTFTPSVAGPGTHTIIYTYVDENGCVNSTGLCTTVSLGIGVNDDEQTQLDGVRVFPNPAAGLFNLELELEGMVSLIVFDTQGRHVINQTFLASGARTVRVVDLSNQAAGSYSLHVITDQGSAQQTLIKQ